jgi:hypothetical protein
MVTAWGFGSPAAFADWVTWTSPPGVFTGSGWVFDRYTPGGQDFVSGPGTVDISYDTTGPGVSIGMSAGSVFLNAYDPNGTVGWGTDFLSLTAQDFDYTNDVYITISLEFYGLSYVPGQYAPDSLDGLTFLGGSGWGASDWPSTPAEIQVTGIPEPPSLLLLAFGLLGLAAVRCGRRSQRRERVA